jgi:hypothetical protein
VSLIFVKGKTPDDAKDQPPFDLLCRKPAINTHCSLFDNYCCTVGRLVKH